MRLKIIAVNAFVVAVVGLLAFLLCRASILGAVSKPEQLQVQAKRAAEGAASRVQLEAREAERWLAQKADETATPDVLDLATPAARGEAATLRADRILGEMRASPAFARSMPTLVAILDASGRVVGRNGSSLQRGEDFAGRDASLKTLLASGGSGSDIWADKDRFVTSYVSIRKQGKVVGALLSARPLTDVLTRAAEDTTGLPVAVTFSGDASAITKSAGADVAMDTALGGSGKDLVASVARDGQAAVAPNEAGYLAIVPLMAFGDGHHGVLALQHPSSLVADPGSLAWPALAALAVGLVLAMIAGWLLGSYISRPINELEEGLLSILNGQTDRRFELQHAELGGLAFRIDQLLNEFMGLEEDTTDAEGRSSKPPTAANFSEAMAVDATAIDPQRMALLTGMNDAQYFDWLYREYIAAKERLGQPTGHVTSEAFSARIRGMEQEASASHGRRIRYTVEVRGQEVTLLAVPVAG